VGRSEGPCDWFSVIGVAVGGTAPKIGAIVGAGSASLSGDLVGTEVEGVGNGEDGGFVGAVNVGSGTDIVGGMVFTMGANEGTGDTGGGVEAIPLGVKRRNSNIATITAATAAATACALG